MRPVSHLFLSLITLVLAPTLWGQGPVGGGGQEAGGSGDSEPAQSVVLRIAIVGASVSDGFRLTDFTNRVDNAEAVATGYLGRKLKDGEFEARTDSVDLRTLLDLGHPGSTWHRDTDMWMFSSPMPTATGQIDRTLQAEPELIYAVDLPFWFAYGSTGIRGRDEAAKAARLERRVGRFREFLEMMDRKFGEGRAHVVLGDIPDLSRAKMLITRPQIPTVEERAVLNGMLAEFAEERDWCHLFSLDTAVAEVRAGIDVEIGELRFRADESNAFQLALVHPTRLGACLLAERILAFAATSLPERLRPSQVALADLFRAAAIEAPWTGIPEPAPAVEPSAEGSGQPSGGKSPSER